MLTRGTPPLYHKGMAKLTVPKTFKITTTQKALLESPKYRSKSSVIIRVLLNLYLNGRLAVSELERLIDAEALASNQRDCKTK